MDFPYTIIIFVLFRKTISVFQQKTMNIINNQINIFIIPVNYKFIGQGYDSSYIYTTTYNQKFL